MPFTVRPATVSGSPQGCLPPMAAAQTEVVGAGGPPGTVLTGTVKSYSSVKGFGFLLHPDIPQDIWFARESLQPNLRTSDLAGNNMMFELHRTPDGKPQARRLWPCGATIQAAAPAGGMSVGVGMGMGMGIGLGGFPMMCGKGFVAPLGKGCGGVVGRGIPLFGMVRPVPQPKRALSPHAGSRAIRKEFKGSADSSHSAASSKSSRSSKSSVSSKSSSSSSSKSRKKDRKKDKAKSSRSSSSSAKDRSRSRRKKRRRDAAAGASAAKSMLSKAEGETSKELSEAKMEALQKLQALQKVEPKEQRAKEWRALLRNWHPDKNPDKVQVATAVFQFLQKGKKLLDLSDKC